jgi:hypothetical protein
MMRSIFCTNRVEYGFKKTWLPLAENKSRRWCAENPIEKSSNLDPEKVYTNSYGHTFICLKELRAFMDEVKAAMPSVDFLMDGFSWVNNIVGVESVGVYREGDPMLLGKLHYRSAVFLKGPGARSNLDRMYIVESPFIKNGAYSEASLGRHAFITSKLDNAVVRAKKFLRALSPIDVAFLTSDEYVHKAQRVVRDQAAKVRSVEYDLRNCSLALAKELYRLHTNDNSVEPNTTVQDLVTAYIAEKTLCLQMEARPVVGYLVMARPSGAVTIVKNSGKFDDERLYESDNPQTYDSVEDLPESVRYAVASLSMLDNSTYVESIGLKMTDKVFWLENL